MTNLFNFLKEKEKQYSKLWRLDGKSYDRILTFLLCSIKEAWELGEQEKEHRLTDIYLSNKEPRP